MNGEYGIANSKCRIVAVRHSLFAIHYSQFMLSLNPEP